MDLGSDADILINHRANSMPRSNAERLACKKNRSGSIRRWFLRSFLILAIGLMTKWQFPKEIDSASWAIRSFINKNIYTVHVDFLGLNRLKTEDLEVLLPSNKSFLWWLVSAPEIEKAIAGNPIVKSAEIGRCRWYTLSCFKVNVVEREVAALFSLAGGWWLIGDDGVMIGQITEGAKARSSLPTIEGGARFSATPSLMRERILAVLALSSALKDSGVKIVSFFSETEVRVSFVAHDYEVVFELGSAERVKEQVLRLMEVKSQLGERINDVSSIDLGFNSQAVVRFKEPESPLKLALSKRPKSQ